MISSTSPVFLAGCPTSSKRYTSTSVPCRKPLSREPKLFFKMIENCIKGTVKPQSSAPYHGRSLRCTSNVGYNTNKGNTDKDNHKNTRPSTTSIYYNCDKVYFPGHKRTRPQRYLVVGIRKKTTSRSRNKTGAAHSCIRTRRLTSFSLCS